MIHICDRRGELNWAQLDLRIREGVWYVFVTEGGRAQLSSAEKSRKSKILEFKVVSKQGVAKNSKVVKLKTKKIIWSNYQKFQKK